MLVSPILKELKVMTRIKLDKVIIISTAAELAEEFGLGSITLLKLADKLVVKTPSLYTQVKGLKDIYIGLSTLGMDLYH